MLTVADVDEPVAGPGEVLVEVAYAGINYADVAMRMGLTGMPFPLTPGVEGSGRVVALGPGVDDIAVGDRIAWCPTTAATALGSYAERIALPVGQVTKVFDPLGAGDALIFQKALQPLTRAFGP